MADDETVAMLHRRLERNYHKTRLMEENMNRRWNSTSHSCSVMVKTPQNEDCRSHGLESYVMDAACLWNEER